MMHKFWMVYDFTAAQMVGSMRHYKQHEAETKADEIAKRLPGHNIVLLEANKVFVSEVTEPTVTKLEKRSDD